MRLTSQRGMSLLLLIIMITVFAGVAIGVVTLLRSRHESYPYQVQSYQAYGLAHAGIEFGIQYIKENSANFAQNPANYIPIDGSYKDFTLGDGKFSLKYVPGCPDALYSKGTYGTATREIQIANFGRLLGRQGNGLYLPATAAMARTCYGPGCAGRTCSYGGTTYPCPADPYPGPVQYSGDRIQVSYCSPDAGAVVPAETSAGQLFGTFTPLVWIAARSLTQPSAQIALGRFGVKDNVSSLPKVGGVPTPQAGSPLVVYWIWDGTCGITGPASQGTPIGGSYCPEKYFRSANDQCPVPYSSYWYFGMATNNGPDFVDCFAQDNTGYYNFPKLPVWNGAFQADGTVAQSASYGLYYNTNQSAGTNTMYDATCRPKKPVDPFYTDDICATYEADTCCGSCPTLDLTTCNNSGGCGTECQQCPTGTWPLLWPPTYPVKITGHYSCFDTEQSCSMAYGTPATRSRATCYFPNPWPGGGGMLPIMSISLNVNLNRITIETIGHLDAILPVQFYIAFYSGTTGSAPTGKNIFVFTVYN